MLTHPTLDQLDLLGLAGMAKAFTEIEASGEAGAMSHAEWLGLLLDREITHRYDRKLLRRLRYARLRHQAAIEDVDYRAARGLDRGLFQKLAEGSWIDAHDNLIITGPTGVGKSWLASALGHKACRDDRSVLYQRVPKLFGDLQLARGDGRYGRLFRALAGVPLTPMPSSTVSSTTASALSSPASPCAASALIDRPCPRLNRKGRGYDACPGGQAWTTLRVAHIPTAQQQPKKSDQ